MQRLFSTFPNGLPGIGLLLLRVSCAAPLLLLGAAKLPGSTDPNMWLRLFSCVTAVMTLGGLWTPIAASCQTLAQLLLALTAETFAAHLLLALNGVSLVLLGPGCWSIDARLYGRKRIDLGNT